MRRFWLIPIGFVVLLIPVAVLAGSGEARLFDGVVHSIESQLSRARHAHSFSRPHQPGVAQGHARRRQQACIVAEFESFSEPVDGDELNQYGRGEARLRLGADDPRDQHAAATSRR